jgi:DNA-binding NarL/FixJ family response regulator
MIFGCSEEALFASLPASILCKLRCRSQHFPVGWVKEERGVVKKMPEITQKSLVCILSKHPLAVACLLQILSTDSSLVPCWMEEGLPGKKAGAAPVFLLDAEGIHTALTDCIQRLKVQFEDARQIVLGSPIDAVGLSQLLSAGAHGFVAYEDIRESIIRAVHCVNAGGIWVDSAALEQHMQRQQRRDQSFDPKQLQPLTFREQEVLHLIQHRFSNREIASRLKIEVSTVKFHLSNIFLKLKVRGRSQLRESSSQEALDRMLESKAIPRASRKTLGSCDDHGSPVRDTCSMTQHPSSPGIARIGRT